MPENKKRNIFIWLLPIGIFLLIFGPAIVQNFSKTNVPEENTPPKVETPISSEPASDLEPEVPEPQPEPEPERLKEPQLVLTTRKIVELKKGASLDYQSYIATATDSKGEDVKDTVTWTEVDTTYTETTQGVTYTLKDKETGEEITDILLVKFLKK